ncbi:MAG TPA: translation initiation factor IF-3 [Candidatus Microsaccharimonas sp.]|nr:translation initiation factor IF-3 [Candidatus Microsaccharimonas sp.]
MSEPQLFDLCCRICYNWRTKKNNVRTTDISKFTRLNEQIRAPQLRVIDDEGKQLGVMSRNEALQMAKDSELDLVEISPDANPPVAKIVDWGKFNYQKTKQANKNKKMAKALEMKQMRFGLKIGDHDLDIKMGKVRKFLEAGHKVKITIFYRGRELAHKEIGFKLADRVIQDIFGDSIVVDQNPQFAGKQLNFVIRQNPKAPKVAKPEVAAESEPAEQGASVRIVKAKPVKADSAPAEKEDKEKANAKAEDA